MIRRIGVVIPAANEQDHLGDCLRALRESRRYLSSQPHHDVQVRVVVVLDNCQDDTAVIARCFTEVETVAVSVACVGTARRYGAARMLRSGMGLPELWLANTDADSQVPHDWLVGMLDEARSGAHLVLGTVVPASGLSRATAAAWYDRHLLRDGHPHVHGANFGIRADTYASLGGWPALATGEDHALARRAAQMGHLHISRTAKYSVETSLRRVGRAPDGFAAYLDQLDAAG